MANPLTFLLPLRYDTVRTVLLVQSGPPQLAAQVAGKLRTVFPDCEVHGVVREDDREIAGPAGFAETTVVRWEDRVDVVRRLRRRRYDAVVALLSSRGSQQLRLLPYLLRTRTILAFNDNLDYFPLHATRLASLAHHMSGRSSILGLLRWTIGRAAVVPFATLFLVASVGRIYLRSRWRRAGA